MLRESVGVEASWSGVGTGRGAAVAGASRAVIEGEGEVAHEARCASVHRRLKRIVKARGALDMQEAEALREAERLRVWRHYGYSSLLEYMEMEMGHSPRAALERLRVANAIVELPAIAEAMSQGELSFSAARELTRVATAETEGVWLEAAGDKNLRQVEALVSGHKLGEKPSDPPDPSLRKRRLRFDELEPETVALVRQARQIVERECGERMSDDQFLRALARMVIDGAAGPERKGAPYQLAVVTCEQCKRAWQDGGGISVEMSPAAAAAVHCDAQHIGVVDRDAIGESGDAQTFGVVDRKLVDDSGDAQTFGVVDRKLVDDSGDAQRIAVADRELIADGDVATAGAESHTGARIAIGRARTAIPPALRRKVKARDRGTCRVPWCRSSRNIDQHHLTPVSEGGRHTLENLITLCESHHLALHEGSLVVEGDAANARFTRRAHDAFANAQHAVETTRALKALGFERHEVKAAIERTRAHVGTSAVSLEQWIKVALSYCPKPTS